MASVSEEIAALRGTRPATFRTLLRDPAFSRLYRAILVSSLGDWIGFVAVVALVTRIGGGSAGFAVSGVMLARLLPSILFGPFAGVLVDRFDRKRLMVIANHNHDVAEYWEFSGEGLFPVDLSNEAYKLGINYYMYGMTH